nr:unnamed protein product [Callosobruchus chinensis]
MGSCCHYYLVYT